MTTRLTCLITETKISTNKWKYHPSKILRGKFSGGKNLSWEISDAKLLDKVFQADCIYVSRHLRFPVKMDK